ncbi:MAG: hypothetical protein P4N60_06795 [Verrucomicrobiae bacterium]|nr:hypothetical protein [Verrucomicrobiae bacterium]
MRTFLKRLTPINAAIAIGSPLLIVGWHMLATWDDRRLDKIADELCSTADFYGAPHPNHAGTKLFYAQTGDQGINAYLVEPATELKLLLFSHDQSHLQGVGLLGWSTDDSLLAYSVRSPHGSVVICGANSATPVATVPESKIILDGVWLSPEALVYVNNNQDFSLLRKSGEEWHKSGLFPKPPASAPDKPDESASPKPVKQKKKASRSAHSEAVKYLTALSGNSVAWQQGGTIWKYAIGSEAPVKVWEAGANTLLNFSFSADRNVFRMSCTNVDGRFIYEVLAGNIWDDEPAGTAGMMKVASDGMIKAWTFFPHGQGYAYATASHIVIQADTNSMPVQLPWSGGVDALSASDHNIFVIGAPSNGPVSIWNYDFNAGSLTCAVPGNEIPFKYSKVTDPTEMVAAEANGTKINYHLFPPANFVAGRKYPLVISFSGHHWRPQEAAVVNAGCFLATCSGIPPEEDTLAVYRSATQNPNIDVNRVYAMGVSAGAHYSEQLLQSSPKLWRGAVLLSPVVFPPPAQLKVARLLIDSGGNDAYLKAHGGLGTLTKFQDEGALVGMPVTLAFHEDASHVYRSKIAEKGRILAILKFLAAD